MNSREPGDNIVLMADSYKMGHWKLFPPNTRYMGYYFESRSGGEYPYSIFFGLQYLLKKYFMGR